MLQHSLTVYLEAPASPHHHVEMLVAAAPDKAETLQAASHHAFIKQAKDLALLSDEDFMVSTRLLFPTSHHLARCISPYDQFTCEGEEFLVTTVWPVYKIIEHIITHHP